MTLSRKIAAALDDAARAAAANPPGLVAVDDGPNRLTLDVTSLDAVGVAFDALEHRVDRGEWSSDALNAWGDRIARRVTYLMEPLRVVEIDSQGGEVQIRSDAPTARGETRGFYEIRLNRAGACRLQRLAYDDHDRQRRPTECHLTREVLERLVDDLAAAAAG